MAKPQWVRYVGFSPPCLSVQLARDIVVLKKIVKFPASYQQGMSSLRFRNCISWYIFCSNSNISRIYFFVVLQSLTTLPSKVSWYSLPWRSGLKTFIVVPMVFYAVELLPKQNLSSITETNSEPLEAARDLCDHGEEGRGVVPTFSQFCYITTKFTQNVEYVSGLGMPQFLPHSTGLWML